MASAQHILISNLDSGTESMLIKSPSVREGEHELLLERKKQENTLLPGKVIVDYLKKENQLPKYLVRNEWLWSNQEAKVLSTSLCKMMYDEYNSTDYHNLKELNRQTENWVVSYSFGHHWSGF